MRQRRDDALRNDVILGVSSQQTGKMRERFRRIAALEQILRALQLRAQQTFHRLVCALLRPAQARGSDHLHPLGDLLRRFDGTDPAPEIDQ